MDKAILNTGRVGSARDWMGAEGHAKQGIGWEWTGMDKAIFKFGLAFYGEQSLVGHGKQGIGMDNLRCFYYLHGLQAEIPCGNSSRPASVLQVL